MIVNQSSLLFLVILGYISTICVCYSTRNQLDDLSVSQVDGLTEQNHKELTSMSIN